MAVARCACTGNILAKQDLTVTEGDITAGLNEIDHVMPFSSHSKGDSREDNILAHENEILPGLDDLNLGVCSAEVVSANFGTNDPNDVPNSQEICKGVVAAFLHKFIFGRQENGKWILGRTMQVSKEEHFKEWCPGADTAILAFLPVKGSPTLGQYVVSRGRSIVCGRGNGENDGRNEFASSLSYRRIPICEE